MAWEIRFSKEAEKTIKKMDKHLAKTILSYMREIADLENPKTKGKPLIENLAGFWRYRVQNIRIICELINDQLIIYVLKVKKRETVYR